MNWKFVREKTIGYNIRNWDRFEIGIYERSEQMADTPKSNNPTRKTPSAPLKKAVARRRKERMADSREITYGDNQPPTAGDGDDDGEVGGGGNALALESVTLITGPTGTVMVASGPQE